MDAGQSRRILAAVALATFMTYLDNNIVNVALPTIERQLQLSVAGLEWVVSAYVLVFAGLLLVGGRLADAFGRRRLFLTGLTIFTAASLASGLAGNVDLLIASRAVQGFGAALVTPTTLAIISASFTDTRGRNAAVGAWQAVGALALALGPVLGGVISQHLSCSTFRSESAPWRSAHGRSPSHERPPPAGSTCPVWPPPRSPCLP
ncbi:MAG: MFS transporter [Acidimicrobiales bacterium]